MTRLSGSWQKPWRGRKKKIAELALHLDGAFLQYHGNPTKDRSFANLLSASDRFGFDEKRRTLWLSNSV